MGPTSTYDTDGALVDTSWYQQSQQNTRLNMDVTRDEAEAELHDALDEAHLTPDIRDRIDDALAYLICAERAAVLHQLISGIKRPEDRFPESWVDRPLS